MDRELSGWSDPASRLRDALENNELGLYCQSILPLKDSGRPAMAETLVRMHEEEKAMLPPGAFLPIFEHYHMMPQLDRWVVRRVLERLRSGSRVPRFTVNVSSQTLLDSDFPNFVGDELRQADVPEDSLVFEFEEIDMLERLPVVIRFTQMIRSLGAGVLLDGFGQRSTTFAPLQRLSLDYIKVDGGIVRKLIAAEHAARKLRAIAGVAKVLGVAVIAECVENEDVLRRLESFEVDYTQGFALHRPEPIDSVAG